MTASTAPTPEEEVALRAAISPDRLATYEQAAKSRGVDVLTLYVWDRDLAAGTMADLALLEVALRNAMSQQLAVAAGRPDWYVAELGFDNRSLQNITNAWKKVPSRSRTPGRVVAQFSFGFWRDLLEAGGAAGYGPRETKADYEALWRGHMSNAFPGGRAIARSQNKPYTRASTLDVVKKIHALRNRVAHHEPLVNGFPLPGEQTSRAGGNRPKRLTARDGHEACLALAGMLDRHLHNWLTVNSQMAPLLTSQPGTAPPPPAPHAVRPAGSTAAGTGRRHQRKGRSGS